MRNTKGTKGIKRTNGIRMRSIREVIPSVAQGEEKPALLTVINRKLFNLSNVRRLLTCKYTAITFVVVINREAHNSIP